MSIDLSVEELQVLSAVIDIFKAYRLHHKMSCSDDALLNNIYNKVDNALSI